MITQKAEIAVVVPVYNSAATLQQLTTRLVNSLEQITTNFAIILVDDRGPQEVWPILIKMSAADDRIKAVRLSRNFGQHPAISAGISVANAEWYVVMDCDLQDLPEDIPKLYKHAVSNQYDSVIATRASHATSSERKLASFVFNKTIELLADIPASEKIGNFRIFNHSMAEAFRNHPEQMRFFHALMNNLGFNVTNIDVERPSRAEGVSSYTMKKLIALAFDAIIANSIKPLYYMLFGGFCISFFSAMYGFFILFKKFITGIPIEGWASIITSLFFLSGVVIFTICLVGIYVGQVFFEVKRRPIYIVQDTLNIDANEN